MGKRAKAEKPAIRHAAQTEKEDLLPLRPFPDELFRWCLGNNEELFLKLRRHAPDRRTAKAGPLWNFVPLGASLTVKGRSRQEAQRIQLQMPLVKGLGLLREREDEFGDEVRFDLARSFALGYERSNHAQRFILLPCSRSLGETFEQYIERFTYGTFLPRQMRFAVDIATKQEIRVARCFDPYCNTGHLAEEDYVMRFESIRIWHEWATLKLEPCSVRNQPYVFFEPPRPLLQGRTPDQKKAGRWAFYLYSDSLGNIIFEVVPLAVQYPLEDARPKPIIFDPEYLSRLSATPAFPLP